MSVLRKAGVWLGLVEDDDAYEEPGPGGAGDWGDEPARVRARDRRRYGDDYGRDRGGHVDYGEDDDALPPDGRGERAELDDHAGRGGGWEGALPPPSRNRLTERLTQRRTEREAGGHGAIGGERSNVRPITRDSSVNYLTEDNLALAPRVYAQERPVAAAAEERRYQITTLHPTTYREARTIGEHFREGTPVIMNLTEMEEADARRLVDFGAGLAFGLRGTMERVTNRVFLLSPANVQVTAEDKAKIAEGGFFHQR